MAERQSYDLTSMSADVKIFQRREQINFEFTGRSSETNSKKPGTFAEDQLTLTDDRST
jgi:hypothetical protein